MTEPIDKWVSNTLEDDWDPNTIARRVLELYGGDPTRWTQGANARDANGNKCEPEEPQAVCWCLVGAVTRVVSERIEDRFHHPRVRNQLYCKTKLGNIPTWNDHEERQFRDVVAVLEGVSL